MDNNFINTWGSFFGLRAKRNNLFATRKPEPSVAAPAIDNKTRDTPVQPLEVLHPGSSIGTMTDQNSVTNLNWPGDFDNACCPNPVKRSA